MIAFADEASSTNILASMEKLGSGSKKGRCRVVFIVRSESNASYRYRRKFKVFEAFKSCDLGATAS